MDDIDLFSLLEEIPDDFEFDLDFDIPNSTTPNDSYSKSTTPKDSEAPAFSVIEKLLMEDVEEVGIEDGDNLLGDDFFSDLFAADVFGSGSESGKSEAATPESGCSAEKEKRGNFVVIDVEEGEQEEDEQMNKKRRRKLRNRDSAVKSRERKKLYVKDLEMKSKYLESECRRLDYALRCCMAENVALHRRLRSGRPHGASAAKQESAVLFVESLLLGSLFWLVSIIVCLFLVPPNIQSSSLNPKGASSILVRRGLVLVASKTPRAGLRPDLMIMRRQCRALRTRMKPFLVSGPILMGQSDTSSPPLYSK